MDTILKADTILMVGHLILGVTLWLRVRKLYCYPGCLGFPIFGNLYYFYRTLFLIFMDSMEKYMTEMTEKYAKDGVCFHWIYCYRTSVIVSNPQIVKELAFHPNLADKPKSMYGGFRTYLEGPFASIHSDDLWKLKRKEYNSCLKKSHVDSNYYKVFIKCADRLLDTMLASSSALSVHHIIAGVTQDASIETLFSFEPSLVYHPSIIKFMKQISVLASFVLSNPKLMEIMLTILRPFEEMFFTKVAELRKTALADALNSNKMPLPAQTLSMQMVSRNIKNKESKKMLVNELQELFTTSSHTVTAALTSSVVFLALLPDIQERAWEEQSEIFGNDKRDPTLEDIAQMTYLDRYLKESLRFLGPPFIGKCASADININGMTIPKGANVVYLMRYMRMDPKYWKNPEVFDPDRFLEENNLQKHSYTPFGIGIRSCPGTYYATVFMKLALSKILRRLRLRSADKDFRFEDIRYKGCLMMEMVNATLLQAEERL